MRDGFGWFVLFLVTGCGAQRSEPLPAPRAVPVGSPVAAPASKAPKPSELLAEDRLITTASGATFIAPARFILTEFEQRIILGAPEPNFRLVLVEVEAKDGAEATRAAWARIEPEMRRPIENTRRLPGRNGWDDRTETRYTTSPNEKLEVSASALRLGNRFTVLAMYGSETTSDCRRGAVNLVQRSLKPKGYVRETFAGKRAHAFDAARLAELTRFIEEVRTRANVPGVAFSLVQNDKVVFEGGFGVRELGKPAKVDADTLFIIASNTKALTTLLLAALVDQGKFTWDTPVTSVYPEFKLGDAKTTQSVLMKHLVCACTGLPRMDAKMFFEFKNATAKDTFESLAITRPTTAFGEAYQYSNHMAAAAGFIAGHVAEPNRELGAAYDRALRSRIFEPLGMRTTTLDPRRALRGNHASPHAQDVAEKTVVGPLDLLPALLPVRPTGGAWSSARELTKYVELELRNGLLPNGKRLVSEANLFERRKKQVAMDADTHYGMGLRVRSDWGTPVIFHGGSWHGFQSQMFFLPEHGIGGVILTNSDSGMTIRAPIIRRVAELAFDGKPEARDDLEANIEDHESWVDKERNDLTLPPDAAAVAALAGHYRHPLLGELRVRRAGDGVTFDFGEWSSPMATRKEADGTLSFCTTGPGVVGWDFQVGDVDGRRALIEREFQYEYHFMEVN